MQGLHGGGGELEHSMLGWDTTLAATSTSLRRSVVGEGCHGNYWGALTSSLNASNRKNVLSLAECGIRSGTLEHEFLEIEVFEGAVDKGQVRKLL